MRMCRSVLDQEAVLVRKMDEKIRKQQFRFVFLGKIFANVTIKLYLCKLLLEYEIFANVDKMDDFKLKMDISVRPINGYNVKIKKRKC